MSDDSNSRYRSGDGYGHAPAQGGQGSDPLAELARLIGQNDPFSEFGRDSRAPAPQAPRYDEPAPARDMHYDQSAPSYDAPAPVQWAPQAPAAPAYDPFASHQTPTAPEQHYDQTPSFGDARMPPAADPYQADHNGYGAQHSAFDAPAYGQPAPEAQNFQQQGFQQQDFQQPPFPTSYQPSAYPNDDSQQASDEYYDDAPPEGRRKGLLTVVAVLGLAVVGTAGAFGYRSMFGGSHSSANPPVFRASAEPVKVAPPPQASNDSSVSKLSYDRFGDRSQNEKVVVREEQPVDIKGLAERAMQSATPAVANVASANNAAPVAAAPSANPPSVLTEPRRVRTVQIHPDQPETMTPHQPLPQPANAAPQAAPPPAPAPRQAAMAAPVNNAPTNLSPEPAAPPPARTASHAVRTVTPRMQVAEAPANAPLSLSPNADNAPPAPQLASTRSTPRPAPMASAANGHYLVQVSSQRSEADAHNAFRGLKSKFASVLGDRQPVIRKADLGAKGTYYRAMVGPFASRADAVQLCGSLKAAGGDCVVQSN